MSAKVPPKKELSKKIPIKRDLSFLEQDALRRSERILSATSKFLIKWDGVKQKPVGLAEQIKRLRKFFNALTDWQKIASRPKESAAERSDANRSKRLKQFLQICQNYYEVD